MILNRKFLMGDMMDIQKEWGLFVAHLRTLGVVKIEGNCSLKYNDIELLWEIWQAAKAQVTPKLISVKDKLPSDDIGRVLAWVVEQNSLGKCGFVWNCSHSNGVFSDKFETFQVTHWMPLPDAPQEPAND